MGNCLFAPPVPRSQKKKRRIITQPIFSKSFVLIWKNNAVLPLNNNDIVKPIDLNRHLRADVNIDELNERNRDEDCFPTGIWDLVIDGDIRRSVISAITMDDEFSRNGSCCNTATPLLRNGIGGQQSSRLTNQSPTATANMTSSLECNHDSQHPEALTCIIAGTSPEHGAVDDDEEENAKFTKNVIISYLQTITFQNPKIFQLLHQVNILERDSEEIKKQAVTPRTTSVHREYRDTMLSNIRAELRVALTTRDETDEQ